MFLSIFIRCTLTGGACTEETGLPGRKAFAQTRSGHDSANANTAGPQCETAVFTQVHCIIAQETILFQH